MSTFINYKPNYAIHPGEIIFDYLEHYGWDQSELADRAGLSLNTINRIVQGKPREDHKDRITREIAERFARVFGMKSSFFMNLQAFYDETLPRQIRAEEIDRE